MILIATFILPAFAQENKSGTTAIGETMVDSYQIGIGDIAFDQRHRARHGGAPPGRQIVQHDDLKARVQKRQHGMAANVSGTARNQNSVLRPGGHNWHLYLRGERLRDEDQQQDCSCNSLTYRETRTGGPNQLRTLH